MSEFSLEATDVSHRYGSTQALSHVDLKIPTGCLFGLLGPNGSGKTTLFRLLATLLPLQSGKVTIAGLDLQTQPSGIRRQLGITFQSPALDGRLTVEENLKCHGRIYGIGATLTQSRINELLELFELADRRRTIAGKLSGGLRRRVELAKGLLHRPQLLLLDEPSTGLDPAARRQFWDLIHDQKQREGTTVIVTTHLMEEAEGCEQLLLLDKGHVICEGSPQELQASLNGDRLTLRLRPSSDIQSTVEAFLNAEGRPLGDRLCFRITDASGALQRTMARFGEEILSAEVARPTLEDVFLEKTGRVLSNDEQEA